MKRRLPLVCAIAAAWFITAPVQATPTLVNGLVLHANTLNASGGTLVNDGRLGFFSDLYHDAARQEWWVLSDRGPGGGTPRYNTRVYQLKIDVNPETGEISNFQVLKTLIFRRGGSTLDGFAPEVAGPLGVAFDPEGIVVNPRTCHLLISDEYGPSLLGINRAGQVMRRFDTRTGKAGAQYAHRMEGSSQGRGISALVAINDHEFLVLERNNRGLGVDGELTPANKKVFRIDLTGATDVSALNLATAATLAHPSLAALNGASPEKRAGLSVGPRLIDGSYLVLAGTDNDYSVTQNGSPVQLAVYFRAAAGVTTRIQCTIATFSNCSFVNANGSLGAAVPASHDFSGYTKIPGVLHAYKASPADLARFVRPLGRE